MSNAECSYWHLRSSLAQKLISTYKPYNYIAVAARCKACHRKYELPVRLLLMVPRLSVHCLGVLVRGK